MIVSDVREIRITPLSPTGEPIDDERVVYRKTYAPAPYVTVSFPLRKVAPAVLVFLFGYDPLHRTARAIAMQRRRRHK